MQVHFGCALAWGSPFLHRVIEKAVIADRPDGHVDRLRIHFLLLESRCKIRSVCVGACVPRGACVCTSRQYTVLSGAWGRNPPFKNQLFQRPCCYLCQAVGLIKEKKYFRSGGGE